MKKAKIFAKRLADGKIISDFPACKSGKSRHNMNSKQTFKKSK